MDLPFAPSCERNQQPICDALSDIFTQPGLILELGSGTGQHGVFMAHAMSHLRWQCTDLEPAIGGLAARIQIADLPNLPPPRILNINQSRWPDLAPSAVFAANLLHIASWTEVKGMFEACSTVLAAGGKLVIYGPFNEDGFTSEGNVSLDAWARQTFPGGGLRELSAVAVLATSTQFSTPQVRRLPANNLMLTLERAV